MVVSPDPFAGVRNVVIEARKIARGEAISAEIEGGWSRKAVPVAGYLLSDRAGRTMFLPAALVPVHAPVHVPVNASKKKVRRRASV